MSSRSVAAVILIRLHRTLRLEKLFVKGRPLVYLYWSGRIVLERCLGGLVARG